VSGRLSAAELDAIFDYSQYTKYVDHSFKRVGLS
jgi:adenylosuccinate lyase